MSWTEERVALLKQLWGEGKTAAEIAKSLGNITRNAVIGKAHRLKLSGRASPLPANGSERVTLSTPRPTNRAPRPSNTNAERALPIASPIIAPVFEPYVEGKGIKLVELKESTCRWPLGDPKDENFRFCGCKTVEGLPYCDHHVRIAYQASSRGKLKVDDLARIDQNIIRKSS